MGLIGKESAKVQNLIRRLRVEMEIFQESLRESCKEKEKQAMRFFEKSKTKIARVQKEQIEKETKTLNEKVPAIEEEIETLKEKGGTIEKETKALNEKVGAIEEEAETLKKKVGETETLKENVGAIEEETKTLKEKVRAIEEGTKTLEEKVRAIEEGTKNLEEKVGAIKQEAKQVAKKIEDLKEDALTVQYDSFLERKAKFDHEGDEKLRTFFGGLVGEALIVAFCSFIKQSADLSKFPGWIMTLTVVMSLIFLALGYNLLIGIWDSRSQAENLKNEKKSLVSDFRAVIERNKDNGAGPPVDEHQANGAEFSVPFLCVNSVLEHQNNIILTLKHTIDTHKQDERPRSPAEMAQQNLNSLEAMRVRVMPLLVVAVVIVLAIGIFFAGVLFFVGKFCELF